MYTSLLYISCKCRLEYTLSLNTAQTYCLLLIQAHFILVHIYNYIQHCTM